jgi:hypothetical protein
MPGHGVYSDPYLARLETERPDLFDRFFKMMREALDLNGTPFIGDRLAKCLQTPPDILASLGAFINPNFPRSVFESVLNNADQLKDKSWEIFNSPLLTADDIKRFSESPDREIQGLALKNRYADQAKLFEYVKEVLSSPVDQTPNCFTSICGQAHISDQLFELLSGHLERSPSKYLSGSIGDYLEDNPTLSEEHRAFLILSGITATGRPNLNNFSATSYDPSSIAWIPYLKDFNTGTPKLVNSLGQTDVELISVLGSFGHPYSILLPGELAPSFSSSNDDLYGLIKPALLHRLFWTELCQRPDFSIYRRNAYRTDDLFIGHPILGREFYNGDAESSSQLGGVLYYDEQPWLIGREELSLERACDVLTFFEETMLDAYVNSDALEDLGAQVCALAMRNLIDAESLGFEFNESADNFVIAAGENYTEREDFDVYAELNSSFQEVLSWRKTPDTKKKAIFDLLVMGRNHPIESKENADSSHFLGCMALHESTPDFLIKELAALNDPLINEVIASR